MEERCGECHVPRQGVANALCERCHDPGGQQALAHPAHVLFGGRDPGEADAAAVLPCARCHADHRGRDQRLGAVGEALCHECHFASFARHPEFAIHSVKPRPFPGVRFGHEGHLKEIATATGGPAAAACTQCHEPSPARRDFEPISFDRHCASCHASDGSLGALDPMPRADVLSPEEIRGLGISGDWLQEAEEYEVAPDSVARSAVRHKDEWVLFNMRKLRRELDPQGYEAERAVLAGRAERLKSQVERVAAVQRARAPAAVLLMGQQRVYQKALDEAQNRLQALSAGPAETATSDEARARKTAALETLTVPCALCHRIERGSMAPVAAARPVLVRAGFLHQPHLRQAPCVRCHPAVEKSASSEDVNITTVATCRDCHRPRAARDDCQWCHNYHPPAVP
jgi:hypothetical protein